MSILKRIFQVLYILISLIFIVTSIVFIVDLNIQVYEKKKNTEFFYIEEEPYINKEFSLYEYKHFSKTYIDFGKGKEEVWFQDNLKFTFISKNIDSIFIFLGFIIFSLIFISTLQYIIWGKFHPLTFFIKKEPINFIELINIIINSYFTSLKKYFNTKNKSTRTEYWSFIFVFILGVGIFSFLDLYLNTFYVPHQSTNYITSIFMLTNIIPYITVSMRRLNDIEKSKFWFVLNLIPYIGLIIFSIFSLQPTKIKNDKNF